MTLFPHYFSEEVVPSAVRWTGRPPRIVLRMFHPADGENSGASLSGSVMRIGISGPCARFRCLVPPSVVTRKLVNRRSVTISPSCKAEHVRRSGRYGEMFQRGRKVKEGRRWLMNLRVITLVISIGIQHPYIPRQFPRITSGNTFRYRLPQRGVIFYPRRKERAR